MLIYLASPYTAPTARERAQRFRAVCIDAAILMDEGYEVFCPIAHSHPIEVEGMNAIRDGDFWLNQDFAILKHCDAMVIDNLINGWEESNGIYQETVFCFENGIPVYMYTEIEGA